MLKFIGAMYRYNCICISMRHAKKRRTSIQKHFANTIGKNKDKMRFQCIYRVIDIQSVTFEKVPARLVYWELNRTHPEQLL